MVENHKWEKENTFGTECWSVFVVFIFNEGIEYIVDLDFWKSSHTIHEGLSTIGECSLQ